MAFLLLNLDRRNLVVAVTSQGGSGDDSGGRGSGLGPPSQPQAQHLPQTHQPESKQITASTWIMVVLTLMSVGVGGWAVFEARRANAEANLANEFEQRGTSSAVINSPRVASDDCHPIYKGKPVTMAGTAKMARGATLWEITQPVNDSTLWPGPRAKTRANSSNWTMEIPYVGAPEDKGNEYMILLIGADPTASKQLEKAASSKEYEQLDELPDGVEILAEMCVVRAD